MAAMYTEKEDFKQFGGLPLYGGGQARVPLAQERWGFPFSVSFGAGYYAGGAQSRETDLDKVEVRRDVTITKDQVYSAHLSKDLTSWFTLYGAYKLYRRTTTNRRYDYGKRVSEEILSDPMIG